MLCLAHPVEACAGATVDMRPGSAVPLDVGATVPTMEGMAISFTLILARLLRAGLTETRLVGGEGLKLLVRYGIGTIIYPAITLVGLISPPAMLLLYAAVIAYYLGPGLRALDPQRE